MKQKYMQNYKKTRVQNDDVNSFYINKIKFTFINGDIYYGTLNSKLEI